MVFLKLYSWCLMWILGILGRLDKFARPARFYFKKTRMDPLQTVYSFCAISSWPLREYFQTHHSDIVMRYARFNRFYYICIFQYYFTYFTICTILPYSTPCPTKIQGGKIEKDRIKKNEIWRCKSIFTLNTLYKI